MKKIHIILALTAIALLFACNEPEPKSATTAAPETTTKRTVSKPTLLGPQDFYAKLGATEDAQLLDVRTAGEVALGMIPECTNMDFNDPKFKNMIASLDKSKPVFIYCASGGRSGRASTLMTSLGFNEVYDLQGGFTSWSAEGMEQAKPMNSAP
ncbi:MAG: rhodanese-like domain-containing protein [Bacteroidia bacterium]